MCYVGGNYNHEGRATHALLSRWVIKNTMLIFIHFVLSIQSRWSKLYGELQVRELQSVRWSLVEDL